jgi:hypothetical protein
MSESGYPEYRRRADGIRFEVDHPTEPGEKISVGNEWVVPYNPYAVWKYKCHINIEVCTSIRAIRYIHKYIYKGRDRATAEVQLDKDEIKQYISGRTLGASEGIWAAI